MKYLFQLLVLTGFCVSCSERRQQELTVKKPDNSLEWVDTVHFNTPLSEEQQRQVFFVRNNEEDLRKLTDTARIVMRFSWWRAFHPAVNVRVENRPQVWDSSGTRRLYEEWFALYKENIQRLNGHCPVEKDGKCYGKQLHSIYQQHVVLLPSNQTPKILARLDSIGFWKMNAYYPDAPHTDGSSWNLEVYYKGRYKAVTTDRSEHPIKEICLQMLRMSEYKTKKNEVY
jgi:hypothetical protein